MHPSASVYTLRELYGNATCKLSARLASGPATSFGSSRAMVHDALIKF